MKLTPLRLPAHLLAALSLWSSMASAATLGTPVLESGLGEALRIIFPVQSTPRDRLTRECVKLRPGGEINDISDSVRADIVTTGERQALVLTTVKPVNELVISVGVGLECGTFFLRRYTFLLDLAPPERRAAAAGSAGTATATAAPGVPAQAAATAVPDGESAAARRTAVASSGSPGADSAALASATPKARAQRSRAPSVGESRARESGSDPARGRPANAATVRPEDEPGVLPRTARAGPRLPDRAGARVPATAAKAPLAPPVRSMLKIELGGLDEFLASQPRLLVEQATGMRMATDISTADRQSAAALAADRGFKLAHARYLAMLRDAPDPVSVENEALGKRLDGFGKELSSLKLDLQSTRARADALEASRVPWWWLLIAALAAATAAAFGMGWWLRRGARSPAGPLIALDTAVPPARSSGSAAPAPKKDFTATILMPGRHRAAARGAPAANAAQPVAVVPEARGLAVTDTGAPVPAAVPGNTPETATGPDLPRDTSDDLESFNLPKFDRPATVTAGRASGGADAATNTAAATSIAAATLRPDKNSLTQQLATMSDLSDEAWASYRHSSDSTGVALPFGTAGETAAGSAGKGAGAAPSPAAPVVFASDSGAAATPFSGQGEPVDDLQIDFSLDLEPHSIEPVPAAPESDAPEVGTAREAALLSTADVSDMLEPPALSASQSDLRESVPVARVSAAPGATAGAASATRADSDAFVLDALALPPSLARASAGPQASAGTGTLMQEPAPEPGDSARMRAVMSDASVIMEEVDALIRGSHPGAALRQLGAYLEAAPAQAPPGPWIMLAHLLHDVGMRAEYREAQALFRKRFGGSLPDWDAAYHLKATQLGLARLPGVEIMIASERGKPAFISRLAGIAYRVGIAPEVLFDLLMHREILQLAAQSEPDGHNSPTTPGTGHGSIDFSL